MKLLFKEDWENFPGHVIKAEKIADVGRRIAKQLIADGIAVEYKEIAITNKMPGYAHLKNAGIRTIQQLQKIEDLSKIKGIGEATADKIKEFLSEN